MSRNDFISLSIFFFLVFFSSLPTVIGTNACGCIVTAGNDGRILGIDIPNGQVYTFYTSSINFTGLVKGNDSNLWAVSENKLYRIDLCDSTNWFRQINTFDCIAISLAVNLQDEFLYVLETNQNILKKDLNGDDATGGSPIVCDSQISSILYDSNTGFLLQFGDEYWTQKSGQGCSFQDSNLPKNSGVDFLRCNNTEWDNKVLIMHDGSGIKITEYDINTEGHFIYLDIINSEVSNISGIVTFGKPCCDLCSNNPSWTTFCESSTKNEKSKRSSLSFIVGVSIGIVIFVILMMGLVWLLLQRLKKKRLQQRQQQQVSSHTINQEDPTESHQREPIHLVGERETVVAEPNVVRKPNTVGITNIPNSLVELDPATHILVQDIVVQDNITRTGSEETDIADTNIQNSSKILPRLPSSEEQQEGAGEKLQNEQEWYNFLQQLKLLSYYDIIRESDWTLNSLSDVYDGTESSLKKLKTILSQQWKMLPSDQENLADAIKVRKEQQNEEQANITADGDTQTGGYI